jgi:hypothetical protein
MKRLLIINVISIFLINKLICQNQKPDLFLKLAFGIELKAKVAYCDKDFITYNFLEIKQNGKLLFKDTSLTEYTVEDTLYPIIYGFKNHLELLIETENRPNKNLIYKCYIKNHKLVRIDTIPTFISVPKNLDIDENLEYAGIWDYSEVWGDSIEVTGYNPIIYYEITKEGIVIDSLTTIIENRKIYGNFYGFDDTNEIEFPYKENDKFSKEIERIEDK